MKHRLPFNTHLIFSTEIYYIAQHIMNYIIPRELQILSFSIVLRLSSITNITDLQKQSESLNVII